MKLLAVDANSVLNRAFYGIRLLTTKDGVFTNGIFGFFNILLKVTEEVSPDAVACAFDLPGPTFRHERYEGYKGQRKGMPDELASQLPLLKELLQSLGYRIVECPGYEADDILGTLAAACCSGQDECVIATGDRDSLQLVRDCVGVRLTTTKMGRPESVLYDEAAIAEKYGVTPRQLIQVKALMGDASDNIPGVPGIGEKTALDLISRFGSVEEIYGNIDTLDIKPGVRKKLVEGKELCDLSLELAEINCSVPIETDLAHYVRSQGDPGRAYELMASLELHSLIERFGLTPGVAPAAPVTGAEEAVKSIEVAEATLPGVEAALAGERLPALFRFEGEAMVEFALGAAEGEGEAILWGRAGEQDFAACCALLLENAHKLWVGESKPLYHHGLRQGKTLEVLGFDSQLAAYLLSPSSSSYENSRLAAEYGVEPRPVAGEGLAAEMGYFPALCQVLRDRVEAADQHHLLYDVELPLARVLASMEWVGFELDVEGLREFGAGLTADLQRLEADIYQNAGETFNINSPKQLGEILFGKLGLPARKKTKSGYSTNAEVLDSLRGKHPIIDGILEYRKLAKLQSTYVEGLLAVVRGDGRVHTSFQQTETRTGRISSIEPNMQNIPVRTEIGSNLRRFFRAGQGHTLVDADYSQIELRVLAHIANDAGMIAAFRSGEDIHTQTAAQVFDLPPDFVTPMMRSRAKAVNFGIVYGIGAYSLSQDIGVSVAEADSYIKEYLRTYSGVKKYMDDTKALAAEQGYVTTLLGRRRYLPELASGNRITKAFGERVAMNTPIQGTAADIIKVAMIRVYNRLLAEGLRARLVLQVHDELIVESPLEEAALVGRILKEEMEGAMTLHVPMEVDVGVGPSWYDAK